MANERLRGVRGLGAGVAVSPPLPHGYSRTKLDPVDQRLIARPTALRCIRGGNREMYLPSSSMELCLGSSSGLVNCL